MRRTAIWRVSVTEILQIRLRMVENAAQNRVFNYINLATSRQAQQNTQEHRQLDTEQSHSLTVYVNDGTQPGQSAAKPHPGTG